MNRRSVYLLLLMLAAMTASGSAIAFRGGGGGGGFHGGGFHGGGFRSGDFRHGGFGRFRGGCCGGDVGLFFGTNVVYGYPYPYYPYPYVYYPYWPVETAYGPPSQYAEPGQSQGGEVPSMAYWYHCTQPEGYYPYVKMCPDGWRKVPAQPPGT